MKKTVFVIVAFICLAVNTTAAGEEFTPKTYITLSPLGIAFGSYSVAGEIPLHGTMSLYLDAAYMNIQWGLLPGILAGTANYIQMLTYGFIPVDQIELELPDFSDFFDSFGFELVGGSVGIVNYFDYSENTLPYWAAGLSYVYSDMSMDFSFLPDMDTGSVVSFPMNIVTLFGKVGVKLPFSIFAADLFAGWYISAALLDLEKITAGLQTDNPLVSDAFTPGTYYISAGPFSISSLLNLGVVFSLRL